MQLPSPIPHTLREAVWQALVAILLATRAKDIYRFCRGVWVAFRESGATARIKAAEADKTTAEAEDIRAHTAIDTALLIREMSMSMGQAKMLESQLKEKLASQASIIELQKIEIVALKDRLPAEQTGPTNSAA